MHFQCGRYRLALSSSTTLAEDCKPQVMGILNVTPDSFFDGGNFYSLETALSRAEQMIAEGVDIIDIGGESSRPGAMPLSVEEELARVMPVLYALRDCGKPLSIDTYKPQVMREAIVAGVDMINDINGFRAVGPDVWRVILNSECALCIMHMQNQPQAMQLKPQYDDVVVEVTAFLQERAMAITQLGIDRSRLCIDPGFGFGKTLEHNLALLKSMGQLRTSLGLPVLAGLSRKSMLGAMTGKEIDDRLAASLAAALIAVANGAQILRVHDVGQTVDALKVWQAATK